MGTLTAVLPPGFQFIQSGHNLASIATHSNSLRHDLQRKGFSEKFCGPHAIGMAIHFCAPRKRSFAQLSSSFDSNKVSSEGTSPSEMVQALEKVTGQHFFNHHFSQATVDAVLSERKPVIALMKIRERPEEYHWITLIGASATQYSSLNYDKVELISKREFARACSVVLFPESRIS